MLRRFIFVHNMVKVHINLSKLFSSMHRKMVFFRGRVLIFQFTRWESFISIYISFFGRKKKV